jgi:exodeoxyribonuclease V alpha subunit
MLETDPTDSTDSTDSVASTAIRSEVEVTQVLAAVTRHFGPASAEARTALAVAVRGISLGHVCIDLETLNPGAADGRGPMDDVRGDGTGAEEPGVPPADWARWWAERLRTSSWVDIELDLDPADSAAAVAADFGSEPDFGGGRPLVLSGTNLYLRRYYNYELRVAGRVLQLAAGGGQGQDPAPRPDTVFSGAAEAVLDRYFPDRHIAGFGPGEDAQLRAVLRVAAERLLILAGGPGTGKTRTIAVMLQLLQAQHDPAAPPLRVALAAPTGKAAARMTEAVLAELGGTASTSIASHLGEEMVGQTLHRLLGWRPPDYQRGESFRHDRAHPLPFDVVIVDEASMVSVALMDALMAAVGDHTRLVLVGDPYQLASVETGSVLMDLVSPLVESSQPETSQPETSQPKTFALSGRVVVLDRSRRFRQDSAIAALANAIRLGDGAMARAVLGKGRVDVAEPSPGHEAASPEVTWIPISDAGSQSPIPGDLLRVPAVRTLVEAMVEERVGPAGAGDMAAAIAADGRSKLLCVTRVGPLGSTRWNELFDEVAARGQGPWHRSGPWFPGRPLIVVHNDPLNGLFNGDSGIVVARPGEPDAVCFPHGSDERTVEFARIEAAEPNWAMTVHKSQGSEFDHVVVVIPPPPVPLLTRELLYTAITRARRKVTILGSAEAFAEGIGRRISRASGLTGRLRLADTRPATPESGS